MKIQSDIGMKGRLTISLNDEVVQEVDNLVVTDGKEFVAKRMSGTTSGVMSDMAIGSGTTAAAASQAALVSEEARVTLTGTPAGVVSNNTVTYTATFPAATGTAAITEAGIFNANSGGEMLCRTVFAVVNKGASDSMTITWVVTAS